jgi:hypothetical protein
LYCLWSKLSRLPRDKMCVRMALFSWIHQGLVIKRSQKQGLEKEKGNEKERERGREWQTYLRNKAQDSRTEEKVVCFNGLRVRPKSCWCLVRHHRFLLYSSYASSSFPINKPHPTRTILRNYNFKRRKQTRKKNLTGKEEKLTGSSSSRQTAASCSSDTRKKQRRLKSPPCLRLPDDTAKPRTLPCETCKTPRTTQQSLDWWWQRSSSRCSQSSCNQTARRRCHLCDSPPSMRDNNSKREKERERVLCVRSRAGAFASVATINLGFEREMVKPCKTLLINTSQIRKL